MRTMTAEWFFNPFLCPLKRFLKPVGKKTNNPERIKYTIREIDTSILKGSKIRRNMTVDRLLPLNSSLGNGPGPVHVDKKVRYAVASFIVLCGALIILLFIGFVILLLYNPIHNNPGVGDHQFQIIQTFKGNVTQQQMFVSLNRSGYSPNNQSIHPNYIFLTPYCSASNSTLLNMTTRNRMRFNGWVMFEGDDITYTTFVRGSEQVYSKKEIENNMSCAVLKIGLIFVDELHLKLESQNKSYRVKEDTRCGDLMIPVATFLVIVRIFVLPASARRSSPYKQRRNRD